MNLFINFLILGVQFWLHLGPVTMALIILLLSLLVVFVTSDQINTSFIYNNFNSSSKLIFMNNAEVCSPGVVRLTNDTKWMIGRALYPSQLTIKSNGTVASFSTTFVMAIVPRPGAKGTGHGIAFVMTKRTTSFMGALSADYLGLFKDTSNSQPDNHLLAVEFDTSQSVVFEDPSANHVGLDFNSLRSNFTHEAGYWDDITGRFMNVTLKSGRNIQVWIEYNHTHERIDVTMTLAGLPRPKRPLISVSNVNLSKILEDRIYVGFSSATGNFVADHYILAWSFAAGEAEAPPLLDTSRLPSLMWKKKRVYRSGAFISGITLSFVLLLLLALGAAAVKRYREREVVDEWEKEFWPHRFPYRDLKAATKGFSEEVGAGGFGRVYRGVLSGREVAVKCVNKEVREGGMKEFVAEISSMGRLQHRNLVHLRGWCRNGRRLFIVSDYMPNGSLDRALPGLGWQQRYRVVKGVAAGLLYLHEEWEKRVVHRDIKSSNVLLDAELEGRLGDFGLARLYNHDENPATTRVVGTLGYIAPELLYSGKATPASDVYGFGVMLMEVACGRRPVEPVREDHEAVMVDWVWELYGQERLEEAVDPGLKGDYNVEEVGRVLRLGLFCCHPQAEKRLSIRHVLQILEWEAPLPVLSMPSFNTGGLGNSLRSGYFSLASTSDFKDSKNSGRDGFIASGSRSPLAFGTETSSFL